MLHSFVCRALRPRAASHQVLSLLLVSLLLVLVPPATAAEPLPAIVFVARSRLATGDYLFPRELGPAGHFTTGLNKFAPGSKLLLRDIDGQVRVLIDTARPAGDPLNPLGLRDLQSPDVSFDATRIVFAATFGPYLHADRASAIPRYSWRLFEIGLDGSGLRQITFSDRVLAIPQGPGNIEIYSYYDDLFPAYLADGRIVFSSSRYPSRAPYDGRPAFNLYLVHADGTGLRRITTERSAALHPTPLPDGRILFSRWWINFNQPSETGIYSRIDNGRGSDIARDQQGQPILVRRSVTVQETITPLQPTSGPAPRPTIWPTARPAEQRLTPRPTATATPQPLQPTPQTRTRTETVAQPITGFRLADGTFIYSNTEASFRPARGRLIDGTLIRDAPNSWHLMAITTDGADLQRFAWTPRYATYLMNDSGNDTYNAVQPALVPDGSHWLVAYTTQRDGSMAHTTRGTGIRVARPGIAAMTENTVESIAGHRWDASGALSGPYALAPAGLPDGRIIFSHTVADRRVASQGSYRFYQAGRWFTLGLQAGDQRYELRTIRPDGSDMQPVTISDFGGVYDSVEAVAVVLRLVGDGAGMWQLPAERFDEHAIDDPVRANVPRGLLDTDGRPVYAWSTRRINEVQLVTLHNPNVYANPPLELPYINNSPALGSVAFADIYIDANQFSGASYRAERPDDQVRAVKWITVPVDAQGAFTASAPADTPVFIVLRDQHGRIVRGGNRTSLSIAQGNSPGRPGQVMQCVGCHMGHVSGSLSSQPLAALGWTNIAPAAQVATGSMQGGVFAATATTDRLNDRRGYVPAPGGGFQDRTAPWIGTQSEGQAIELRWPQPVALLEIRLAGVEAGHAGFSSDYTIAGEWRLYLGGAEVTAARRSIADTLPLSRGGTTIAYDTPVAADRALFVVQAVSGSRNGRAAPAALSEIEVIGQGATPGALAARPTILRLPVMLR